MEKIRVGLVGAGSLSHEHTRVYQAMENVELVAVCDIKEGARRSMQSSTALRGGISTVMKCLQRRSSTR